MDRLALGHGDANVHELGQVHSQDREDLVWVGACADLAVKLLIHHQGIPGRHRVEQSIQLQSRRIRRASENVVERDFPFAHIERQFLQLVERQRPVPAQLPGQSLLGVRRDGQAVLFFQHLPDQQRDGPRVIDVAGH